MRIINILLKTFFPVVVLSACSLSLAQQTSYSDEKNTEKAMSDMDHSQHSAHEHTQMMHQMNQDKKSDQQHQVEHQHKTDNQQDKTAQKGDQHAQH